MRMRTLMMRKKSMEIAQIIDDALYEYYVVELGEDVPKFILRVRTKCHAQ